MDSSKIISNSNEEENVETLKNCISKFYNKIEANLLNYTFDIGAPGTFAARISKENGCSSELAKTWINYYKLYMVYVGWLFTENQIVEGLYKPSPNINEYLALPYEILQVWKAHALYMDKYIELCKIVTCGAKDFIPFCPPRQIWRNQQVNDLQKSFTLNKEILTVFILNKLINKEALSSLFNFYKSYLNNCINFNTEIGSSTLIKILAIYEGELQKTDGLFNSEVEDEDKLVYTVQQFEKLIYSCIPEESHAGKKEWEITTKNPLYIKKTTLFQNFELPKNFSKNFAAEHLLSEAVAENYIDEYRKYLYVSNITGQSQTPSEEVDSVWHYHIEHIEEYLKTSKILFGRYFLHMPADGSKSDHVKHVDMYKGTINTLENVFGQVDAETWKTTKVRFTQIIRWINHYNLIQTCFKKQSRLLEQSNSCDSNSSTVVDMCDDGTKGSYCDGPYRNSIGGEMNLKGCGGGACTGNCTGAKANSECCGKDENSKEKTNLSGCGGGACSGNCSGMTEIISSKTNLSGCGGGACSGNCSGIAEIISDKTNLSGCGGGACSGNCSGMAENNSSKANFNFCSGCGRSCDKQYELIMKN
jgi:hypothetical protein